MTLFFSSSSYFNFILQIREKSTYDRRDIMTGCGDRIGERKLNYFLDGLVHSIRKKRKELKNSFFLFKKKKKIETNKYI